MSVLKTIKLSNFRSYDNKILSNLSSGLIVISGANGIGKTNILEAISLLSAGRGLRGAKVMEIQKNSSKIPWAVSGILEDHYNNEIRIGTGLDPNGAEKRIIRINGNNAKSQSILNDYISCVWLTPQMDRLFIDSSKERRKFLDRLISTFDSSHLGRITRYENAMSQRSKLLRDNDGINDNSWLCALEQQMAETGIAIAAARLDFVQRLQIVCKNFENPYFPLAKLRVKGTIEELLNNLPAIEVEDAFKYQLQQSRTRDSIIGGAATGPHKSDLEVFYVAKNMKADQCSTGEQKILLIGLVLAHSYLIKIERGFAPILLLDEVAAHLDDERRSALYNILQDLRAQTWLTGTDNNLFKTIKNKAQFFEL